MPLILLMFLLPCCRSWDDRDSIAEHCFSVRAETIDLKRLETLIYPFVKSPKTYAVLFITSALIVFLAYLDLSASAL